MKKAVHFGPTPGAFGVPLQDITDQCTFSWDTAPTTIDSGTFPDSFLDKDHTTKLAFTSTYGGSGYQARVAITLPEVCHFLPVMDVGVGAQVGTDDAIRRVRFDSYLASEGALVSGAHGFFLNTGKFSRRMLPYYSREPHYGDRFQFDFYALAAGDYKFEIFSFRLLKMVGL
ncbi:MAG: hypothetical protein ACXQS2_06140 [Methermicoccaceae archaeon]